MRRFAAIILILLLALGGCAKESETTKENADEVRAVWISYIDLSMENEKDKSEEAFRNKAKNMIRNLADSGYNTVFLHVRPFGDALYPSKLFAFSKILTGTSGEDPQYDPLEVFCTLASARSIAVHAWINPFRVCPRSDLLDRPAWDRIRKLYIEEPALLTEVDGILYLDPASTQTRRLLLDGARELLENYPIAGVHIDDYFYPTVKPEIDRAEYDAYRASGGEADLGDWRRSVINTCVSQLYDTVKCFGKDKIFSVSPALRIEANRDTMYADVERWGAYSGYCDWLIPQLYVGFEHEKYPFADMLRQWRALVKTDSVRLIAGLPAYKREQADAYAGTGSEEWVRDADVLSRQIALVRKTHGYDGFAIFSYDSIF